VVSEGYDHGTVPPLDVPRWAMVALDVGVWAGWSALVGWRANRLPLTAFERDSWLYRQRSFERSGGFYEAVQIRRWKDRLPEGGAIFAGGYSKRSLRTRDPATLMRFLAETRRAEWTHWVIMVAAPVFLLWSWLAVELVMVGYALSANLPCIFVQRYNRIRLHALLSRRCERKPES
jgi:glycosyl-4,4'-diaponeurosporenoate acyltransferase